MKPHIHSSFVLFSITLRAYGGCTVHLYAESGTDINDQLNIRKFQRKITEIITDEVWCMFKYSILKNEFVGNNAAGVTDECIEHYKRFWQKRYKSNEIILLNRIISTNY